MVDKDEWIRNESDIQIPLLMKLTFLDVITLTFDSFDTILLHTQYIPKMDQKMFLTKNLNKITEMSTLYF